MYEGFPDKEPTPFELKIFKWLFLPVVVYIVFVTFKDVSDARSKCEAICMEKEFDGFRYVPSDRFHINGNKCYCLTDEESNTKNKIPKGTRVF